MHKIPDCVFCKIVHGELDAAKILEDEEFLAILDIMPNTPGMTLIITKRHYDSYIFDIPQDVYLRFLSFTRKVAKMLEKGLEVNRVAMVMEGMGINHAHIKLYPMHGVEKEFREMWAPEKVFFEKYEGYITTKTGPEVDMRELKRLAKKIKESIA